MPKKRNGEAAGDEDDSSSLPGRCEVDSSDATPGAEVEDDLWRRDPRALVRRSRREPAMKNGRYPWLANPWLGKVPATAVPPSVMSTSPRRGTKARS